MRHVHLENTHTQRQMYTVYRQTLLPPYNKRALHIRKIAVHIRTRVHKSPTHPRKEADPIDTDTYRTYLDAHIQTEILTAQHVD